MRGCREVWVERAKWSLRASGAARCFRCSWFAGYAFVSFVSREEAARAQKALDGYGYDNLILHVEFAQPSNRDRL